jgi:hypothetical protein
MGKSSDNSLREVQIGGEEETDPKGEIIERGLTGGSEGIEFAQLI